MKVNMTPNPLDVVTIHASQGDTEARQWEFELHNNGELIDTSEITEQLFFKAYKGGTEQLLPENTSTPTTSPFKGDIKYPQGLLSDQEFLYRESPTEEDGNAKITDIKGNTLVWNQLVQNGNFADTSLWRTYSSTGFSVSNNVGSFTVTGLTGAIYQTNTPTYVSGHKYLVIADFNVSQQSNISVEVSGTRGKVVSVNANTWYRYSDIVTPSAQGNLSLTCGQASVQVKNVMCFDLTKMGLDITDPSDFTSLFSLPYYDYNQGSLLSFNGNGIKTVGKNLFDGVLQNGTLDQNGQEQPQANRYRSGFIRVLPNTTYCSSIDGTLKVLNFIFYDGNQNFISAIGSKVVTTPSNCAYVRFFYDQTILNVNLQFEFGSVATDYEPYTSSILSLPISTYFPNGMDGVGTAYDELNNSWYAKRMGRIDLGSITYTRTESQTSGVYFFLGQFDSIPNIKAKSNYDVWNIKTPLYETVPSSNIYRGTAQDKTIGGYDGKTVRIRDDSFTDATSFKNSLSGQYLVYELATPTETSFSTASLVTENAEIPLSNNDGVLIGKCTEQLSAEPGFHDAKIKLTDSDGTCYSNKLQLHVERSPQ